MLERRSRGRVGNDCLVARALLVTIVASGALRDGSPIHRHLSGRERAAIGSHPSQDFERCSVISSRAATSSAYGCSCDTTEETLSCTLSESSLLPLLHCSSRWLERRWCSRQRLWPQPHPRSRAAERGIRFVQHWQSQRAARSPGCGRRGRSSLAGKCHGDTADVVCAVASSRHRPQAYVPLPRRVSAPTTIGDRRDGGGVIPAASRLNRPSQQACPASWVVRRGCAVRSPDSARARRAGRSPSATGQHKHRSDRNPGGP